MSVDQGRRACFAIVLFVSVGILFSPASGVPVAPPGTDLVVHVVLFAALSYTGVLAGMSRPAAVIVLLVYAAASEVLQSVPALNRSTSLADWLADAAGVGVGVAIGLMVRRRPCWWAPPR
ncbi:MAG: VanZ family protein [Geodermatophilaceae bacterium]|nr:VanZ family protein [Geodermatophilaceae bacterium]